MSFTLEEARVLRDIEGTTVSRLLLEVKKEDNGNRLEIIFAQEEKIGEFQDNSRIAIAKIGRMCMDKVGKRFSSIKASRE